MKETQALRLPGRRDWAWALGLILAGVSLGFALNALHLPRYRREGRPPTAIDLSIALASEEAAPEPQPAASPEGRP